MKYLKRVIALFLAFIMIFPVWPDVPWQFTAYAAAEMFAEDMDNTGVSNTIAYKWKVGGEWDLYGRPDRWGGNSYRYNLKGLSAGQNDFASAGIKISQDDRGFPTYLVMLDSPDHLQAPKGNEIENLTYYNPDVRKSDYFYMAKLGQRDTDGNRITSFTPDTARLNGAVESLTFQSKSGLVKLESKIVVSPSPDNKYMFVDYYLADVGGNMPDEGRTFFLASPFDLQVGGTISKEVYKTARGFYAVNSRNKSTVDIILNDPEIGVNGEADTTKWIGYFDDRVRQMLTNSASESTPVGDYSLAYSWKFKLRPYETIHRRVAFATKEAAYYVSASNGQDRDPAVYSLAGTFKEPFQTLNYAISKCKGKNAYIYIQDLDERRSAVDLIPAGFPANTAITITSADIDIHGVSMFGRDDHIKTLKRQPGYTGSVFTLSRPGTVQFTDITLDGSGAADASALIEVSGGKMQINSGTALTNNRGEAVSVSGNGNLSMNGGKLGVHITGNVSDHGAVLVNGSGTFSVINNVIITDNKNVSGKEANVYLPEGKGIRVDGNLDESRIGVTMEAPLQASFEGIVTEPDQEVVIAEPSASYRFSGLSPFSDNFRSDQGEDGFYTGIGAEGFHHQRAAVLKKTGYKITYSRIDEDGGKIAEDLIVPIQDMIKARGDLVSVPITYSGAAPEGYRLTGVETDYEGFQVHTGVRGDSGHDKFDLTGVMPAFDVRVTYLYQKKPAGIVFHANGGSPEPEPLIGKLGDPINSLIPAVSRYGYKLKEEGKLWSKVNDRNHPDYIDPAIDWLRYPESPLDLYAIFVPDTSVIFPLTEEHLSQSGYAFHSGPAGSESVETPVRLDAAEIPGYLWSPADSKTVPAKYNYGIAVSATPLNSHGSPAVPTDRPIPIGVFRAGEGGMPGRFAGSMPGQAATVSFVYKVDPSVTFPLTVRYQTEKGNDIFPAETNFYSAETPIRVEPAQKYGYECRGLTIDSGDASHSTDGMVSVVNPIVDSNFVLGSRMPNQPVQITYTYKVTDEGYPITAKYIDNGAGDPKLKNIISPAVELHPADSQVHMAYRLPYGYELTDKSMTPSPGLTHLSFDSTGSIAGIMYEDEVTAVYGHSRIPDHWAEITYMCEQNARGSLAGTGTLISSDLQPAGAGKYKASVLIDDGSGEGGKYAWSLNAIEKKGLMPGKTADYYYMFDGWFIDSNGNGSLDEDEELLKPDQKFTGPLTLTAHFKEDPDKWVDIRFAAGNHGAVNPGQTTALHTTFDKTWGDIEMSPGLPEYTPEVNYLQETEEDGHGTRWYDSQNQLMTAASALKTGETYTTRFYKNPGVFGTNTTAPKALAELGSGGEGRITVFHAAYGYRYVLADKNGKVIGSGDGEELSSRVYFDDLPPGGRYKLYEAPASASVTLGSDVSGIPGLSDPTDVLMPVVDTNFRVTYDENDQGKTKLTIRPAYREVQYALLDVYGNVVHTPETGAGDFQRPEGNPGAVAFTGLGYNKKYTVVARRNGASDLEARSLKDDGSVITSDPGGELELERFLIKINDGTIKKIEREEADGTGVVSGSEGEAYFSEAHKGDTVQLTAEAVNSYGKAFNHWEFTIGGVSGLNRVVRKRELSFSMPAANLVLTAVYDRAAAEPEAASVVDEVREGSREELALSPEELPVLEGFLTTEADRVLLNTNHTSVKYRVVYQKTGVKATESNAVKAASSQFTEHGEAYKGAWGLNVSLERYVGGRKVNNASPSNASPSNASFKTWVQLGRNDVDMMDYELYDVTPDPDGEVTPVRLNPESDPEETGGLFRFTAIEGHRYVMAYSRSYRLSFKNDTGSIVGQSYNHSFKVRRNEAPADAFYAGDRFYGGVSEPLARFISPNGAIYKYRDWSRSQTSFKPFDPYRAITRNTDVYAWYDNDEKEVADAREELWDSVARLIGLSNDHFLKNAESEKLKGYIETAQETFERKEATREELSEAIRRLEAESAGLVKKLDDRYDDYGVKSINGNKGGSRGGGGGGAGTKHNPYNDNAPKNYRFGYNGKWVQSKSPDGRSTQLTFVLNGGVPLRSVWARLENPANPKGTGIGEAEKAGEAKRDGALQGIGETQQAGSPADADMGWYRFNDSGKALTGWIAYQGSWYYCNTEPEGSYGRMATGFRKDVSDGNWYYLDPESGAMATGWRQLDGKWYYFDAEGAGTYSYDSAADHWIYGGGKGRPLGAMYMNEETPDGYRVGPDGAWLQSATN